MDYLDSLREHHQQSGGEVGTAECRHRFPHISSSRCPGPDPEPARPLVHDDGTICWHEVLGADRLAELRKDSFVLGLDRCEHEPPEQETIMLFDENMIERAIMTQETKTVCNNCGRPGYQHGRSTKCPTSNYDPRQVGRWVTKWIPLDA